MLRPIYIIILLLCIEWTFSYNYIDDASGRGFHKLRRRAKKSSGRSKKRNLLRQDYNYDRIPVEFDVASFIQSNDENIEEEEMTRLRNKKRRRLANNNEYGPLMHDRYMSDDKRKENGQDFLNFDAGNVPELSYSQPLFNDMPNTKHINMNNLDYMNPKFNGNEKYKNTFADSTLTPEKVPAHNPGKKSAFKSIKIPFFSHNKSGTNTDTKKNKKRKLFCFSCAKKDALRPPEVNKTLENPALQYKIKRSYEESLCPACKKKFISVPKPNDRRKKTARKIIHNSRQFYQKLPQVKIKEDLKKLWKYNIDDLEVAADDRYRKKREPVKSRQLKELDEIERKVDDVQVTLPKFERPPDAEPQ